MENKDLENITIAMDGIDEVKRGDRGTDLEDITFDVDAMDELLNKEETFWFRDFPPMSSSPSSVDLPRSLSSSSSCNLLSNPINVEDAGSLSTNFLDSFEEFLDPNSVEEYGMTEKEEKEKKELGEFFLGWLKNNRNAISPEDLRRIKLNEATIECAAARLGGGREGRMQLVQLVLAWVQNHHLRRNDSLPIPMPMPMPGPPVLENAYENPNPHSLPFTPMPVPGPPVLENASENPNPKPHSLPFTPMPVPLRFFTGVNSSATKEARKKRMARKTASSSSQHHPYDQSHATDATGNRHKRNATPLSEKQQNWNRSEKNLRFLLQKVLKQTDVGSLGRIVLPKKEAESHLPELDTSDGMEIPMEDIGTSRVWNMRYRYWPNNKSRIYLLENTGDFVRINGLQEGDFIVIYSDVKHNKYMIRGVKVRRLPNHTS